jgi:hypothetical protein
VTGSRRAGALTGVAAPRTGLVLSTVTIAHLAFEWECRACHGWRPVADDDLCQDCVARIATGRAESSAPPQVTPVEARQLRHHRVERGSS